MEVRTCKNCKRLFNYLTGPHLCAACRDKFEDIFVEVKTYIRENPGTMMQDIVENFDVPMQQVKEWVREERLQFTNAEGSGITCEKCGTPIASGRYCEICKRDLTHSLMSVSNSAKAPTPGFEADGRSAGAGMRFVKQSGNGK